MSIEVISMGRGREMILVRVLLSLGVTDSTTAFLSAKASNLVFYTKSLLNAGIDFTKT